MNASASTTHHDPRFVWNSVHVSTKKLGGHEALTKTDDYQGAAARRLRSATGQVISRCHAQTLTPERRESSTMADPARMMKKTPKSLTDLGVRRRSWTLRNVMTYVYGGPGSIECLALNLTIAGSA